MVNQHHGYFSCSELQAHASNGGGMINPIASDPYKTFWKDMQAEPSQELTPRLAIRIFAFPCRGSLWL